MRKPNRVRHKKESRKAGADARKEAYDKLSIKERIALLDKTFGTGIGAKKHRAKLIAKLSK